MAFLFRLAFAVFWLVLFAFVFYVLVLLANRLIQFLARQLGYEVGDFFSWMRSILPKRKRRRFKPKG